MWEWGKTAAKKVGSERHRRRKGNNSQKAIGNYLLSINEKRNKNFKNEIYLLEKAYLFLDKAKTKIEYQGTWKNYPSHCEKRNEKVYKQK